MFPDEGIQLSKLSNVFCLSCSSSFIGECVLLALFHVYLSPAVTRLFSYPGKATPAARAALPSPTSACCVSSCCFCSVCKLGTYLIVTRVLHCTLGACIIVTWVLHCTLGASCFVSVTRSNSGSASFKFIFSKIHCVYIWKGPRREQPRGNQSYA